MTASEPARDAFALAPLTRAEAEITAQWRYPADLATYDGSGDAIESMLDRVNAYSGIHLSGEYIGFVCVGPDARVPGLDPIDGVDDLGMGLTPSRVGRGLSRSLVPELIAKLRASGQLPGHTLRAVVLDWNLRSQAAMRHAGFAEVGTHRAGDRVFIVMTRPLG